MIAQEAQAIPASAMAFLEFNEMAQIFFWKYIVYAVQIWGPGLAVCKWALPAIYKLTGFTKSKTDSELNTLCKEGIKEYWQYFYYAGSISNRPLTF